MKCFKILSRRMLILGVFLTVGVCAVSNAWARQPKPSGAVHFSDETQTEAIFLFRGTAEGIGRYVAYGELDYVPGDVAGTKKGTGVVVVKAACGDLLVGEATSQLDAQGNTIDFTFHWSDSVTLRNGRVVSTTGRFLKRRPPGLVVSATAEQQSNIITILIRIILGR